MSTQELRNKLSDIVYEADDTKGEKIDALVAFVQQIEAALYNAVNRLEVIDDTGRAYVKGEMYSTPVNVQLSLQDDNRTLKIFVQPALNTLHEKGIGI